MHLLLDIAHEQSVAQLLQKLILRAMEQRQSDVACVQIWLVDKGDLCSVCPQRPNAPTKPAACTWLLAAAIPSPVPERVFRVSMIPTRGCHWDWVWLARWLRQVSRLS